MKQFFKILLASFCAILLFFIISILTMTGLVAGLSSGSEYTKVESNSVLLIDLNENYEEQGQENSLAVLSGGESSITGLNDVLNSIKSAKEDDKIKGIYIRSGICNNGWASMKEIKDALIDFKSSKKFIISYGEITDQKSYYVASVADQIYLNPAGAIEFKGLSLTGTFYKGTLEKLGVTSEAFHCGKYKGAYEPFKLDKFSDPNRYQLSVILNDFYSEFLQTVSKHSSIDTATLAKMADEGSIKFPKDAEANHLINGLIFSDSVESMIKSKLGIQKKEKINFVEASDYANSIQPVSKSKDKIAILYASGEIHDGEGHDGIYSKTFTQSIRKISNDESIKGVVLRINSPGGSALASEILFHELMQLKTKKPIVVSMGNYAASGGYYIACASDSMFGETNSLTGSIGVVGVLFNIGNMMKDKLGITFDQIKTSQYADFPNLTRPMSEMERAWIQSYLDSTYSTFKSRVASARNMSMVQVEELAQGHVYSGKLAKELNLIDAFGNQERAIRSVASMAKLKDYKIVEYPKPVDPLNEMIASFSGKKREDAILKKMLGEEYTVYKEIQKVRSKENQIQMILPFNLDIR